MGELLYITGNFLLSGAIRTMLTGAGLTLTTAAVSVTVIQNLIADVSAQIDGLPALAVALIDLSSCDVALSLIFGALIARTAISAAKLHLGVL